MSVVNRGGRRRGFSLVEVAVALAVFLVGVVGVLQYFPPSIRASNDAAMRGKAVMLAQQKAEELRRDVERNGGMVEAIKALADPTTPVVFPEDNRLAYQFHSRSMFSLEQDSVDREDDDFGVARVIVRYNPEFRAKSEVLVELRFDR